MESVYLLIDKNQVVNLINTEMTKETDPEFFNTLESNYTVIKKTENHGEVFVGDTYNPETSTFSTPDRIPNYTREQALSLIRVQRDVLIENQIWLVQRHAQQEALRLPSSLTLPEYQELLLYIEALRQVPQNLVDPISFLNEPNWPQPPSFLE